MPHSNDDLAVRDARDEDLPALAVLKSPEAVHHDRMADAAESPDFRYLVLVKEGIVIGFACLVFVRPRRWSDADDTTHLPQVVDLLVSPAHRRKGYGSFFLGEMEALAKKRGSDSLYIAVDYPANVEAHALYLRLSYQQLQSEPYPKRWQFTASDGSHHQGNELIVDMVKTL
jgi:GNAT superfamily N-acetyltransferase